MNVAREISQMSEAECFHVLATEAQPGSIRAIGVAARLQQIQLDRLSEQTAALVSIAEAQRVLAAKLERQTNSIIRLTWFLAILTAALLIHEVLKEHFGTHPLRIEAPAGAQKAEPAPAR